MFGQLKHIRLHILVSNTILVTSEICSVKTGCAVDMCVSTDDNERQIQSESEEIKDKRKQILYILNCLPLPKSNRTVCGILKETSSIILNAAPQCAVYLHK